MGNEKGGAQSKGEKRGGKAGRRGAQREQGGAAASAWSQLSRLPAGKAVRNEKRLLGEQEGERRGLPLCPPAGRLEGLSCPLQPRQACPEGAGRGVAQGVETGPGGGSRAPWAVPPGGCFIAHVALWPGLQVSGGLGSAF